MNNALYIIRDKLDDIYKDESWGNADINIITGEIVEPDSEPGDKELYNIRCNMEDLFNDIFINVDVQFTIEEIKKECNNFFLKYPSNNSSKAYEIINKIHEALSGFLTNEF